MLPQQVFLDSPRSQFRKPQQQQFLGHVRPLTDAMRGLRYSLCVLVLLPIWLLLRSEQAPAVGIYRARTVQTNLAQIAAERRALRRPRPLPRLLLARVEGSNDYEFSATS